MKNILITLALVLISASAAFGEVGEPGRSVLISSVIPTALTWYMTYVHNEYSLHAHADVDAAAYLSGDDEASPALKEAMMAERGLLAKYNVEGSEKYTDQQVAYLVMKRAHEQQR